MSDRIRTPLLVAAGLVLAVSLFAAWAVWTAPVRNSVRTYTQLLAAANGQNCDAARRLCTERYAQTHSLRPAPDGGIVGLPRNIHKNFQAWRNGANVWLCPTNRVGPVYQFVKEAGIWRFDGPVGILHGQNQFVPLADGGVSEPGIE